MTGRSTVCFDGSIIWRMIEDKMVQNNAIEEKFDSCYKHITCAYERLGSQELDGTSFSNKCVGTLSFWLIAQNELCRRVHHFGISGNIS